MVKPGYKQTEIGVIPQTWNIITFSKCFKILSNNTFSRAELNENSGTVKNIHYGDILVKYNSILNCSKESIPYISNLRKKATYMYLLNGDLIIADTAEDETVGKAVEISNIGNQKIVSGLHTIPCRSLSDDLFANGWLGHYINHSTYHNQLLPFITGTKVSAISKSSIAETLILVPPIPEQERIAEALSDVDDLIFSLEKLIEKYKSIKATCLQQMFPKKGETIPKMRLPGFTGAWEQRKVGELLIERNEQAPMNEEYPLMAFIANEGVAPKGERYDRSSLVTDTENKLYKRTEFGDFIYSSNNLETGSIGLNKYGKACISPVYSIFHPTGIADSNFLGRRLVRKDFINSMVKWRQGVIYGQWRIHESDFLKIEISVPSVKEQRQIGTFLDYLDNLITLHQRKLYKAKKIKQGMMQQLLTGKIRLV